MSFIGLGKSDPIDAFIILQSIDGIGYVCAAGIIAEIGDITAFHSSDAPAKYAGLCWKANQSDDFDREDTPMIKAGNRYLRYYLGETANSKSIGLLKLPFSLKSISKSFQKSA